MDDNSILSAYSELAPDYEQYSKNRQVYLDAVDDLVISRLDSSQRLLDVGAGDGRRLQKFISTLGLQEPVAVEPSAGMAKICNQRTGLPVHEVMAEDLDRLDIGLFDVVTALWNVLGHIPESQKRLAALQAMGRKLSPNGLIILDINNRHNAAAYGNLKVLGRVITDLLFFDEHRGDASYDWKIGDKIFKGSGHLFVAKEIEELFSRAGLRVQERFSVNYATGVVSSSRFQGQLFYILSATSKLPA